MGLAIYAIGILKFNTQLLEPFVVGLNFIQTYSLLSATKTYAVVSLEMAWIEVTPVNIEEGNILLSASGKDILRSAQYSITDMCVSTFETCAAV